MKYRNLILSFLFFTSFAIAQEDSAKGTDLEKLFVSKAASYFCYGNKNFLPCINRDVELGSESCIAYVIRSSKACADQHIYGANLSNPDAVENIGVAYTQCSMLEMLEVESTTYGDFEQCFNSNYSESNVHQTLNK